MDARDLVTTRLALQARRFPELDLQPLDTTGLDARDAALASAIDHAVRRRWLTLVTLIQSQLSPARGGWEGLEAPLQASLLAGTAQLMLLERLPDHAVINESVEWIKRHVRPKAGGLVNAVLRKIATLRHEKEKGPGVFSDKGLPTPFSPDQMPLSDGGVWRLAQPVFDDEPVRRLAQQTSHPEPVIAHWTAAFGHQTALNLALHSLVLAPIIVQRLDPLITMFDPARAENNPDENVSPDPGSTLLPHDEPGFHIFTGDRSKLQRFLKCEPDILVQDPASAAPARATVSLEPAPKTIIDVCAGKGTKSRQLAAIHPQANLIVTDINEDRLALLCRQFETHPRFQVIKYRDLRKFDDQADLLVLDVPCSNTGVLARRVEAKYRFTSSAVQKIIDLQRQIIADSIPLLAESGNLLYSTCSVEPAENQQQAQWLAKWHRMRIAQSQFRLPQSVPGDALAAYADGGYFAILRRAGF